MRTRRRSSNQAIRIPRDFELPGNEALIRKEGDRLTIEPVPPPRLLAVLATLDPIDETFPDTQDLVVEPVAL
ncbi:antitoxin [Halochromatium glycolicum]|uniref:AbrB/MazE/SpoVT family DNA-binding domain-containing protein n=1 Tax=Halochromatium glycolicum TaxID=85075 RepID=A0AAJ0U4E6_9GAMM|nr:AbrB/MazE/SpoVT family DNA-binding domain-containing protein [Halochromatium glycolicum]MBK1705031.1 AbrB/MazE/SpoVT family DNA-binding domain-containing protein [Halochromatium glycolicum]